MDIREALTTLNGWWQTGRIGEELARPYRRKAFSEASRIFGSYRQILMLTGLRRVGKSTLIYQLISDLLKDADSRHVLYFTFDVAGADLLKMMAEYQRITGSDWKHERTYLFLDEVQKLQDWSSQVKTLYDAFPNLRIVLSGSASLQLESKAISDLAGRYFAVDVRPLSIIEYYELRYGKKVDRYEPYRSELLAELDRYVLRVFPEIVGWKDDREIKGYIRESVISKIIRVDLPDTFPDVNFRLLEGLVSLFFSRPGMIMSPDALSKELGVSKTTLENHLYYLEFSRLIRVVRNFRPNVRMESRKLKKVYPYDISLALADNSIDPPFVAETLVASSTGAANYWRMGINEVDFVLKKLLLPIEVKSGTRVDDADLRGMRYFIRRFRPTRGIVIYSGAGEQRGEVALMPMVNLLAGGINAAEGEPA